MSLDWDVLSVKYWWEHPDGEAHKPLDVWKGFLGRILELTLNLIIMFIKAIVEALSTNAIVMREHTEKG